MPNAADIQGDNNRVFQDIKDSTINYYESTSAKLPKDLTLKLPKVHLSDVIGRENELDDLHRLLFDNQQVVLVNGLGGIGKTTLAQAYLSKYYDQYAHVAWISQSSDALMNAFVNDEGLKKNLNLNTQGKDLDMIFNEIMLGLKSITSTPNLLLIDNAETSLTAYVDVLPHQPNWHVLVTSRENIERFYLKELGFLTPEKALELFRTHCTRITDEVAINDLLKTIDYHTLTIEILAKTAQIQRNDIITLKTAIENDLKANVFVNHKGEKIDRVRSYLSSIFDLSKLNENEIWLMKQFACLPAEFHSYDLLLELINPKNERQETFAETLEALVAKGWLLKNTETDSYKMHMIIGEVTKQKYVITLDDVENLIKSVSEKLDIDQTKDNPIDKFQWIPFGQLLTDYFEKEMASTISKIQNNLAIVLRYLGDYAGAKVLLEKAKNSTEASLGESHPYTATCYSNLATILRDLGDYGEAKVLLVKVKNSFEENFGESHPSTVTIYSNLAAVLRDLGDYEGAKVLLEKAKDSDEANFGKSHPTTAIRYSNLALVLKALGDYEGAKILLEKAKNSFEENFGESHPTTAINYSNLAAVLQDLGDYEGAKVFLEKAKDSDEVSFGKSHPTTANRYSNLAMALKDLGDYVGAKELLEKAYKILQNHLGDQHPNTKIIKGNLDFVTQLVQLIQLIQK